jgi:hypothetical protein
MKKITTGIITAAIIIITLLFVSSQDGNETEEDAVIVSNFSDEAYNFPPMKADELLKEQDKLEASILAESKGSTFENPYVTLDPYKRSPLSALILFETEENARISISVKGKNEASTITKTFKDLKTNHTLPIVGLYPDHQNEVEITAQTESGDTLTKTVYIRTEALPDEMPNINIREVNQEKMSLNENDLTFYIPSTRYAFGFDINGDVRWYGSGFNSHILQELDNGNLLYLGKDDNSGSAYNRLLETDYLGKLYHAFEISEEAGESEAEGMESTLIHHDVAELPWGNLLLTVNDGKGEYMEDIMVEMDRESGEIVKVLDLKDLFPREVYEEYEVRDDYNLKDWFHQNSVVYDEQDDSIIISGRHQDTVMKIDYETNEIKWILAYPEGWDDSMTDYLIEGMCDNFKYPAAQHDATILPDFDQDPATIDILLFDNNIVVTRGDEELSEQYSAATHYRINEETLEGEVIWTFGEELGEDNFTRIISSARYLDEKDTVLIDFGHTLDGKRSSFIEVTHEEPAEIVFEAEMTGFKPGAWAYRTVRNSLYNNQWEENYSLGDTDH